MKMFKAVMLATAALWSANAQAGSFSFDSEHSPFMEFVIDYGAVVELSFDYSFEGAIDGPVRWGVLGEWLQPDIGCYPNCVPYPAGSYWEYWAAQSPTSGIMRIYTSMGWDPIYMNLTFSTPTPGVTINLTNVRWTEGEEYIHFIDGQGVPEPATWAMMIAGFGMIGTSMRRARAQFAR